MMPYDVNRKHGIWILKCISVGGTSVYYLTIERFNSLCTTICGNREARTKLELVIEIVSFCRRNHDCAYFLSNRKYVLWNVCLPNAATFRTSFSKYLTCNLSDFEIGRFQGHHVAAISFSCVTAVV